MAKKEINTNSNSAALHQKEPGPMGGLGSSGYRFSDKRIQALVVAVLAVIFYCNTFKNE